MKISIEIKPDEFTYLANAPIREFIDRLLEAFTVTGITRSEIEEMLEDYLKKE